MIGLGGSVEILGVFGTVRADWNPAFGLLVVPLVFLARFNGYAVIGFTLFFSALMIGGDSAARRIGVPQHFVLVLVALAADLPGGGRISRSPAPQADREPDRWKRC